MVNSNIRRVTLRDVARVAGVSAMTVSRALRQFDRVAPATGQQIRELARKMGYSPDPHLTALAVYRQRLRHPAEHEVIAYLTTDDTRQGYRRTKVGSEPLRGAAERAAELGYRVEPIWLADLEKHHRDPSEVLAARGIRAIVLARLAYPGMKIDLRWERFATIAVGYSLVQPEIHVVASHLFQNLSLAFEQVRALGYRRPALLLSADADSRTRYQFHGAFLFEQQSLPADARLPILWTEPARQTEDLRNYLRLHEPDVIFSVWPETYGVLLSLRLRPPAGIGYVNLNVDSPAAPVSGVYQDFAGIGAAAVNRLNVMLQSCERGIPTKREVTALFGQWCPGKTLRRIPVVV